ncbi:NAD(P)/FAD-dependent oxidoreductase [Novosphingobium resinovorum]|uniref:NAD(P)/FAD-dependent oxidoreductase n=1 Tax=Novosphingobium resinovorum TaxID=158500 RepID=UPI002ED2118A|nr:FAD-dependent oxidoreductase [Novosphingobium resinovorum]
MSHIVIIGGGFAGLWSAVSAARRLGELGRSAKVSLVNLDPYHSIRVRNYEDDLSATLVKLDDVLGPIGVEVILGQVTHIDAADQRVTVQQLSGNVELEYDKLILASGSRLAAPDISGFAEHCFDIDTHAAAMRLQRHIAELGNMAPHSGQFTALVIGSGATGVELATELPTRLARVAEAAGLSEPTQVRVILADRADKIASQLGGGQPVIERACAEMGIELRTNLSIARMDARGVVLTDGSRIDARTVIWCAGMQADPLTMQIPGERDAAGRLYVDSFMQVMGAPDIYAAGDTAHALIDGERPSVMSCQHARPMGRYAGTNAVNALFHEGQLPLMIDWYTNIIDLGPWGAVYTQGWDRQVVAIGEQAKNAKTTINRVRIYPPIDRDRGSILAAGTTDLERPPFLPPLAQG